MTKNGELEPDRQAEHICPLRNVLYHNANTNGIFRSAGRSSHQPGQHRSRLRAGHLFQGNGFRRPTCNPVLVLDGAFVTSVRYFQRHSAPRRGKSDLGRSSKSPEPDHDKQRTRMAAQFLIDGFRADWRRTTLSPTATGPGPRHTWPILVGNKADHNLRFGTDIRLSAILTKASAGRQLIHGQPRRFPVLQGNDAT